MWRNARYSFRGSSGLVRNRASAGSTAGPGDVACGEPRSQGALTKRATTITIARRTPLHSANREPVTPAHPDGQRPTAVRGPNGRSSKPHAKSHRSALSCRWTVNRVHVAVHDIDDQPNQTIRSSCAKHALGRTPEHQRNQTNGRTDHGTVPDRVGCLANPAHIGEREPTNG